MELWQLPATEIASKVRAKELSALEVARKCFTRDLRLSLGEPFNLRILKDENWRLYNIEEDPSEKYEMGDKHSEIIDRLKAVAKEHSATIKPYPSQLEARIKK